MIAEIFPLAIYLGLTATPWRLSPKESLGDIFSALVCAPMPKELIEAGFLVKPSYYGFNFALTELDKVEVVNGDYDVRQLGRVCDRPEIIEQICQAWFDLAYNRPTIAFTVGIAHAEHIAESFNNHGITAAVVTGKTPIAKRNELYQSLSRLELMLLASCAAVSEGFDVPQVSCVIPARPTKSKALYFQQLGRGLRLAEDKRDCLVLDPSGNVVQHGFIEDLESIELVKSDSAKDSTTQAPLKICPRDRGGCGAYVYTFYMKCPHCQYNFDLNQLISVLGTNRLISPQDEVRLSFYRSKLREAFEKNFAPSWAAMTFKNKHGFFPPFDWARGAIFNHQDSFFSDYADYLQKIAFRLQKERDWIERYLRLEFGQDLTDYRR